MDRPRVASAVATMLDPGGAVVQADAPAYRAEELAAQSRRGTLPAQTVIVPDRRAVEQTADDLAARVFSSSSTAPHLFGGRRDDYEADVRKILARASPAGRFSVRLPDNILRIWRIAASN